MKELIEKENIALNVICSRWEDAIIKAGELLVNTNHITNEYVDEMVETVKELGPYIVIAPHIAIAHARPSASVIKEGISMMTLKEPVRFGNEDNDPVQIIFCFGAKSQDNHLEELKELASIIENSEVVEKIKTSNSKDEIYNLINKQ